MSEWTEKVKATKERHNSMSCKTFELKISKSHLSTQKLDYLKRLFLEAKWFYNNILSTKDVFTFDTKSDKVIILNKDKQQEEREITNLSSQMKQAVKQKITYSIKSLSSKKKSAKGKNRTRRLKFTSNCKAITLNQFNATYRFKDEKYLVLQGSKYRFKIEGLKQIPENSEITCSTLITRHNDFYLKVVCFLPKEIIEYKEESVGIDFGLTTTLTLSNGEKLNLKIKENYRLRKSSQRLKKRIKGSKNYFKMKNQVNKEYHKLTNRKKDKKNKIVSHITKTFKTVIIQDENIKAWHSGRYGKSVQHSLMGGIMRDLENKSHTFIKVNRFFPSTQLCPTCGNKKKIHVSLTYSLC